MGDEVDEKIRKFLSDNEIHLLDEVKLLKYLKKVGVHSLDDLARLKEEDLIREEAGLALLQARKFLDCAQQLGSYGHPYPWPTFPSGSPSLAGCSDTSTDFESAVSRFHRPGITVRYIFCENLFQRYVTEERISSLDPMKDTLNGLCKLIGSKERIDRDLELELFSHEGYPFNANMYTMDRTLAQWKVADGALLYVFARHKIDVQPVTLGNAHKGCLDPAKGHHTLKISNQLFGNFQIKANLGYQTSGDDIIKKVSQHTNLPSFLFELYSRGENATTIGPMKSTEALTCGDTLTMVIKRYYFINDGTDPKFFGKCTYKTRVTQTDRGYATFYSILFYLTKHVKTEVAVDDLVAYVHKEYRLPPMTYALKYLLEEGVLKSLSCWVALVEGFYQLFKAMLSQYWTVPDDSVFEFSVYLWGMIIANMHQKEMPDATAVEWTKMSLVCPLSHLKIAEPVNLPDCDETFDRLSVMEKVKAGEVVRQFPAHSLKEESMRTSDLYERLLMYTAFDGQPSEVFVWDEKWEETGGVTQFRAPHGWYPEKEPESFKKFLKIVSPDDLDTCNTPRLTFLENGNMAVFIEFSKAVESSMLCILYNPLYNSAKSEGEARRSRDAMRALASSVEYPRLSDHLNEKARSTCGPTLLASVNEVSSHDVQYIPEEAIMITLDESASMDTSVFKEKGDSYSRLVASKDCFKAFVDRTLAYYFKHVIGVTKFSTDTKVVIPLSKVCRPLIDKLENLATSSGSRSSTKLYDALMTAGKELVTFTSNFPNCCRRILCLTDGMDNASSHKPHEVAKYLKDHHIVVDTVLLIPEGNLTQKAISHASGGFCFRPESAELTLKLFELETLLTIRKRPTTEHLKAYDSYKDETAYPYNSTQTYGAEDVRTNFKDDLDRNKFTTALRVIQHSVLVGVGPGNMRSTSMKRLFREIRNYQRDPHEDVEVFPSEESAFVWKMLMKAPGGTPYEGGIFELGVNFPPTYPQRPPEIRFVTPIYHCNINSSGRICHSILDRHYVPSLPMKTIIGYIFGLLMSPEPADPLDSVLAQEYHGKRVEYEEKARNMTTKFAKGYTWEQMREKCAGSAEELDAPGSVICPLTKKLFEDPVSTSEGYTYERSAILEYLAKNDNLDPRTRQPTDGKLTPNHSVKNLVKEYKTNKTFSSN